MNHRPEGCFWSIKCIWGKPPGRFTKKAYAISGGRLQIGIAKEVYRDYEGTEYRQVGNSTPVLPTGGGWYFTNEGESNREARQVRKDFGFLCVLGGFAVSFWGY